MKTAAIAIGAIFLIGGIAGSISPREWTYTTGSRLSATQGPWIIDKNGTKVLSIAAAITGLTAIYIGIRK